MPAVSCCSDGALVSGAEQLSSCLSEGFFLSRSQCSNGNGIPSYLVGPIQNIHANSLFADSHTEIQAGFYQRDASSLLSF